MDVRKMRNELLGKRLVAALESRNMEAYYVETKEEAVKKALELIPKGSSINMGGATSVKECGLYEALSNGEYQFYDRDKVSTQGEKQEIALKAFTSDYFLGSVNAMSEDGVFINIDGNANRVAAYAYGPEICGTAYFVRKRILCRSKRPSAQLILMRLRLATVKVLNSYDF